MVARPGTTTDVLLIEPDPELGSAVTASLAEHKAVVRSVATREQALAVLGGPRRPELIILDLDLPENEGLDLLRTIKSSTGLRHIPTIAFAGASDPDAVERAWDVGANCVIRKPERRDEFQPVLPRLSRFWLAAAVLPRSLLAWAARG